MNSPRGCSKRGRIGDYLTKDPIRSRGTFSITGKGTFIPEDSLDKLYTRARYEQLRRRRRTHNAKDYRLAATLLLPFPVASSFRSFRRCVSGRGGGGVSLMLFFLASQPQIFLASFADWLARDECALPRHTLGELASFRKKVTGCTCAPRLGTPRKRQRLETLIETTTTTAAQWEDSPAKALWRGHNCGTAIARRDTAKNSIF